MLLQPGTTLLNGKYRVEAMVGQGASAEVYRVVHTSLRQTRALKVLRRDMPGMGSTGFGDYRQRFRLEAQLGAQITHPNVIQVFDFEDQDDQLMLVMEYAPGGSLVERLARYRERGQAMPIDEAVGILLDIANGLSAVHDHAVHRDLKPGNILFDANGHAKVADLGLAQIPGGPSLRSQLSTAMPHPGTPSYMSPEQASSGAYLSPASDIYAVGLIAFEMLTGKSYRHERPGTSVAALRRDVPPKLDELVGRMLSIASDERPFKGNELLNEVHTLDIAPSWHPDDTWQQQATVEAEALRYTQEHARQQAEDERKQRKRDEQQAQKAAVKHKADEERKAKQLAEQRARDDAAKRKAEELKARELAEQKKKDEAAKRTDQSLTQAGRRPRRLTTGVVIVLVIVAGVCVLTLLSRGLGGLGFVAPAPPVAQATESGPNVPIVPTATNIRLIPESTPIPVTDSSFPSGPLSTPQQLPQNFYCPFRADAFWLPLPNSMYGPFSFGSINYAIMFNNETVSVWNSLIPLGSFPYSYPNPAKNGQTNQWIRLNDLGGLPTPFLICVDTIGNFYEAFSPPIPGETIDSIGK